MVNLAIIGLGARGGEVYGSHIINHPGKARVVAIADPDPEKRATYAKAFSLDDTKVFISGEALLDSKPDVHGIIIATPDRDHHRDAVRAIRSGYDLLLEKPIATNIEDVLEIRNEAILHKRNVMLCHVLRYAPLFRTIKDIIVSGQLGTVVNIQQTEHIGYWHFAHSFVRGNWRNSDTSAPIILAKTSHDLDLILWYADAKPTRVSSYGGLNHFHGGNAPEGAPSHCVKGCPVQHECPFDAKRIYVSNFLQREPDDKNVWPFTVLSHNPTEQSLEKALLGPYGRCVYKCDNNVMDHQLTNIAFANGIHANLTLSAFSGSTHRQVKIMGTKGELEADDLTQAITIKSFDTTFDVKAKTIDIRSMNATLHGHGGGDARMMDDFIHTLAHPVDDTPLTSIGRTADSHILAFKAEQSRMHQGQSLMVEEEDQP